MNQNEQIRLTRAIAVAIDYIRDALGEADVGDFEFRILSSGRTQTGTSNVKVEYSLSGCYGDNRVTGDGVTAIVEEFLRRKGWNKSHAPLAIVHDSTVSDCEE